MLDFVNCLGIYGKGSDGVIVYTSVSFAASPGKAQLHVLSELDTVNRWSSVWSDKIKSTFFTILFPSLFIFLFSALFILPSVTLVNLYETIYITDMQCDLYLIIEKFGMGFLGLIYSAENRGIFLLPLLQFFFIYSKLPPLG